MNGHNSENYHSYSSRLQNELFLQYNRDPSVFPIKGEIKYFKKMTANNYKSGFEMHFDATQNIQARAKEFRKRITIPEKLLWEKLRDNHILGFKFRRQHPIMIFVVDFYCHKAKLVIEVDGPIHNLRDNIEYDAGRTYELEELGLRVIRFSNEEVENNLDKVVSKIKNYLVGIK